MMLIKKDKCCGSVEKEGLGSLPAHSARHTRLYGHPVPNLKNQKDIYSKKF
jgi:hypothetical protein